MIQPLTELRRLKKRLFPYPQERYLRRLETEGTYAFIHINKCGGTSVETALGLPLIHDTVRRRIRRLGRARWEALYTFAVVRHPYAKVASHYRYRIKTDQTGMGDGHIDLNDWIQEAYGAKNPRYLDKPLMFAPCIDWLTDQDGQMAIDQILKLETIDRDWAVLQSRTDITAALPHHNKTIQDETELSAASRAILDAHFIRDFETFGYVTGPEGVTAAGKEGR